MKIKKFEFNMFPVNCYVLSDETNEAVIIDPGCFYEEETEILRKYVESHDLHVKHLLNTHLHVDHIFGNPFIYKTFGLLAEAHQADEFWLEKASAQAQMFGLRLPEPTVPLGGYLNDGDKVYFGQITLQVIHVPGHSPGSIVFYNEQDRCMFSGDTLFHGSIGRADLKGGNFDDLRNNIRNKLFTLPPETKVYPGHGDSTTIESELNNNPFFR